MSHSMLAVDITIVGAGPVGTTAAIALLQLGYRVALINHAALDNASSTNFDSRSFALAPSSIHLLKSLSVWNKLKCPTTPIHHIHVSLKGHFGSAQLSCEEVNVPFLGHIIPAEALNTALHETLTIHDNLHILAPASITSMTPLADAWHIHTNDAQHPQLSTRLLLVADGVHSATRQKLGIPIIQKTYSQTALIANIKLKTSHQHT